MEGAKEGPTNAAGVNFRQDQSLGRSSGRTASPLQYRARARAWMQSSAGGGRSDDEIAKRYFERGVEVLLLTHGKRGVSVRTRSGLYATVPATRLDQPVIDTMGGGDATLASIIALLLAEGTPNSEADWRRCLQRAMDVAGATCRSAGAALVAPPS